MRMTGRITGPALILVLMAVAYQLQYGPLAQDVVNGDGSTTKFLTYNVHQDDWTTERGRRLAAVIDDQMPDVVTLQEVGIEDVPVGDGPLTSVRSNLEANLADDYQFYFPESLDPILVRRASALRRDGEGSAELYECRFPRVVNWLRLQDDVTGRELIIYNTHLCPWVMRSCGASTLPPLRRFRRRSRSRWPVRASCRD